MCILSHSFPLCLKMDKFCIGIDSRFKTSVLDSTMLQILHSAMNKAHEKVRSKEGVIERLNEQSKFCELAIMQLEACLKFVQEEAGSSILDNMYDRLLPDLKEIKNRLYGRLRETEIALAEKDRELLERTENERKLKQALRAKEKELQDLKRSEDGNREGDISDLRNSVDQPVLNIKQQLEGEKIALTRRMSQLGSSPSSTIDDSELLDAFRANSIENAESCSCPSPVKSNCSISEFGPFSETGLEQMGLEIDRLKETVDTALGMIESTILSTDIHPPLEVLWMQTIENDIQSTVYKEFVLHLQNNLHPATLFSIGVSNDDQWSELINEVALLRNEIVLFAYPDEGEGKGSEVQPVQQDEVKNIADECSEKGSGNLVARMIKSHESIIKTKIEESNWTRVAEMVREKGETSPRSKYIGRITKCAHKLIKKLDVFLERKSKVDTLYNHQEEQHEGAVKDLTSVNFQCDTEIVRMPISCTEGVITQNYSSTEKEIDERGVIQTLKDEIEQERLQCLLIEQIYKSLYESLMTEFEKESKEHELKDFIKPEIFHLVLKDILMEITFIKENKVADISELLEDNELIFQLKDGILGFVLGDMLKSIEGTNSFEMLLEDHKQKTMGCMSEDEHHICERDSILCNTVQDEIHLTFLKEMAHCRSSIADEIRFYYLIRENVSWSVFTETVKDFHKFVEQYESCIREKTSFEDSPRNKRFNGNESLIETLDYLLSNINHEDFLMQTSGDKEEIACFDSAKIEHKSASGEQFDDEARFSEVSYNLELTLYKLAAAKLLLKELEYNEENIVTGKNFEIAYDDGSEFSSLDCSNKIEVDCSDTEPSPDQQDTAVNCRNDSDKIPANKMDLDACGLSEMSSKSSKKTEGILPLCDLDPSCSFVLTFDSMLLNFGNKIHQKLNMNHTRLQKLSDHVKTLFEHNSYTREREMLYKKAFLRRCQNLQKAEIEVDILGDQVEAFARLLKRIYSTLNYYSPVLQHLSGVLHILVWIRKELNI